MPSNSSTCYLRSMQMTYNNTLPRVTLISPYPKNTKEELDMRRKAEVLKHQGPQRSTQMNTLTKKQKFAQTVRGYNPLQKALKSKRYTLEQITYCDSSNNKTLSSSSDVPGIPVLLYMDRSIPLYNYANGYKMYNDMPTPGEVLPWRFFTNEQATSFGATETNIGTLKILKDITSEISTFSINIPVSTTSANISGNVELIVKYANQVISYINPHFTYVTTSSNIHISNITLYTVDEYFYDFFLKIETTPSVELSTGDYITLTQES